MKKIVTLLVAGCAIGILTGCGIPEEVHDAQIKELNDQHAVVVDKLKGELADKSSLIKNEKDKARVSRIELDDATQRINGLQQKNAEAGKVLASETAKVSSLASALKASKSMTVSAEDRAMESEKNYSTLDVEYQELKRRFEMFQKNLNAIGDPSPASTVAKPTFELGTPADSQSPSNKASSLLDQMGTM